MDLEMCDEHILTVNNRQPVQARRRIGTKHVPVGRRWEKSQTHWIRRPGFVESHFSNFLLINICSAANVIIAIKFNRIDGQLTDCIEREGVLLAEIRGLEAEYTQMKTIVDGDMGTESQFHQELQDADKDADKMSAKESIYLEKQVSWNTRLS